MRDAVATVVDASDRLSFATAAFEMSRSTGSPELWRRYLALILDLLLRAGKRRS